MLLKEVLRIKGNRLYINYSSLLNTDKTLQVFKNVKSIGAAKKILSKRFHPVGIGPGEVTDNIVEAEYIDENGTKHNILKD